MPSVDAATDRAPRARGLAGVVLLVGVLAVAFALIGLINQLTQPGGVVAVTVPDPSSLELDLPGLPEGSWLDLTVARDGIPVSGGESPIHAGLQIAELPAWLRALTELPALVAAALIAGGAVLLRLLLVDIARGRPFAPANVGRLRGLGVVVLAVGIVPGLVASLTTVAALEHLDVDLATAGIGYTILDLPLGPLIGSALLFVVAQVFAHGRRLTEDVEGLV